VAPRLAVLVAALAVCAWFALGIGENQDREAVTTLLNRHLPLTIAQARAADKTLDAARLLDPDESIDILRSLVASRAGENRRASAIARSVVQREPQNLNAWLLYSFLNVNYIHDPTAARIAEARIHALAPTPDAGR
jgi:hypothetical protein